MQLEKEPRVTPLMESKMQRLIDILEEWGHKHRYYYHYTTIENFVNIINTKSFYLTYGLAPKINDRQEVTCKGTRREWKKIYLASFTFGDNENMALWGLYGVPKEDAVRIDIPRAEMLAWIQNILNNKEEMISRVDSYSDKNAVEGIRSIAITDIVYIGSMSDTRGGSLSHSQINLREFNEDNNFASMINNKAKMTGIIKNVAWKYENEVRLIVRLKDMIDCEKISIRLPDAILEKLRITSGPCFNGNIRERISDISYTYSPIFDKMSYSKSEFFGLVNYRSICDCCRHKHFVPWEA